MSSSSIRVSHGIPARDSFEIGFIIVIVHSDGAPSDRSHIESQQGRWLPPRASVASLSPSSSNLKSTSLLAGGVGRERYGYGFPSRRPLVPANLPSGIDADLIFYQFSRPNEEGGDFSHVLIYLFAGLQGLTAWFHNWNPDAAAKDFKLGPEQRLLYAQTVGYPA